MLDPDEIVLCEHGHEDGECPVCRAEERGWSESIFDVEAWAEAYDSEHVHEREHATAAA
jgi:hypothetical protein